MPRIDPIQLLNCLSVLLSSNGGIKSRDEVQRLASLMTKFSKKLVSKCIYIQILKCTETELLGLFMGSGGWSLVHTWLTESVVAKNSPLIKELLELLLLCPVDIERLKTNNCPKLVKELSRDGNNLAIRALASKLVEQWLKTVKSEQVIPVSLSDISQIVAGAQLEINSESSLKIEDNIDNKIIDVKVSESENTISIDEKHENIDEVVISDGEKDEQPKKEDNIQESETLPVLKISLKDGRQIVSHVEESETKLLDRSTDSETSKEKHKNKNKEKSSEKSSSDSKSRSSKHSSKSHLSSDKHKSSKSSSSSSRHSSKDKSRDKDKHSKSRSDSNRKSSDKSSSSSSRSKDDKSSKSSNKDKRDKEEKSSKEKSDDKSQVPSIQKLGKIPKLSDIKKDKPSISIEVRKPDEPKPKTVKTFHSKFRKHGLEEEVKPPPSRAALLSKKPTPVLPPTVAIPKRPSPVHNEPPPEKKPKTIETIEKPGAIKLIPPKPKRPRSSLSILPVSASVLYNSLAMMLLESDMFMDALNASTTNKKDPKKRKRRTSGSKDGNAPSDGSPPLTPTIASSPVSENKSVPPRFYQDTLETEATKDKSEEKNTDNDENTETNDIEKVIEEKMDTSEPHTLTINGLKGVLCYHKKKGPKKSIKWKSDLEEIQYFELDETERVNVTKTFTDMKYLERIHEREAFQKGRNLSTDDVMEEKTNWRPLILIDVSGQTLVEYGKNSKEKDIQAIRQKGTLQPLYFHKSMIPDSALEPDAEAHPYSEPTTIPLEDITGNQDNVSDFRNMPWPEPKGNAPPNAPSNLNIPAIFPPNMPQFPTNFPNAQFPVVPNFQPPNMVAGEWANGMPPQMIPNGLPVPIGPTPINPANMGPGNIPPGMMLPPENMMMGPEMFNGPNPMFPVPPDGFNMQQNMFPMDFNMSGPQGQGGPGESFPGPGNFRGAMRGRGSGGHWRGKGPGNWDVPQRGRGGSRGGRKAVCIYFQRKGSCRQGDNCTFLHPGVNCPY